MTELLIKSFLEGRESTRRCCIHMHTQGSVWVKERHTHEVKQSDLCTFSQEVRSSKNAGRELTPENPPWRFRT